jgi:hypothetical protein
MNDSRQSPSSFKPGSTEIRDYTFDVAGKPTVDRRHFYFADRAPTPNDDSDEGFRRGSTWLFGKRVFFLTDSVSGNAEWVEIPTLGAPDSYIRVETDITALDGGPAGENLSDLETANGEYAVGCCFFLVIGGIPGIYQLIESTDAQNLPFVVRPADYATGTNEKVWVQRF